jgi:hypothetical protein
MNDRIALIVLVVIVVFAAREFIKFKREIGFRTESIHPDDI